MNSARISGCGKYRYFLTRDIKPANTPKTLLLVMLNPSTADWQTDDPTIRKLKKFSGKWGYDEFIVLNLYAYRAADPKELWRQDDPIGPENDTWIKVFSERFSDVLLAWGANAEPERAKKVLRILKNSGCQLNCLGVNANGSPKHPLYLPYDTERRPFNFEEN